MGLKNLLRILIILFEGWLEIYGTNVNQFNMEASYCNMGENITGKEGAALPGYSLLQAHVFMSPGLTDMRGHFGKQGQRLPPLLCDLDPSSHNVLSWIQEQLKISIRAHVQHGRSHPEFQKYIPNFNLNCSTQDLSMVGFEQLAGIGQHLRRAYLDRIAHKALKAWHSSVYLESVISRPAFHSVLGLVQGLLPMQQTHKLKIRTATYNFCNTHEMNLSTCVCEELFQTAPFISQALNTGRYAFKHSSPDKGAIESFYNISLQTEVSTLQLVKLILQYKCANVSVNCDSSICSIFKENNIGVVLNLAKQHTERFLENPIYPNVAKLSTYPYLQRMVSRASRIQNQSMFVTMGNQHFLHYLVTSLGVHSHSILPLASRLVIEIYKKNDGKLLGSPLFFKVLMNGKDVTPDIPECLPHHRQTSLCSLHILVSMVTHTREHYLARCSR
ncbi:PXYP1-like protein [Mya arenaria]|uniref:PXYP1-like protein n=1 Tax=Mya arenaria TaxID=6604 RepID=A0ABY7DU21_MYAAR|nr:2-phosphoxylose phosphatase 1-like [Mya arenaria]WAR00945.1 PXYP1-like protein [Mya arenaria]